MADKRNQHSLFKRGEIYWIDYRTINKDTTDPKLRYKRLRMSLETKKLSEAKERRDAIIAGKVAAKWGEETQEEAKGIAPIEFWGKYLKWAKRHKAPRTIEREDLTWRQFTDFVKPETLGEVDATDIERFKEHCAEKLEHQNVTINDSVTRMGALYARAKKLELYDGNNPFHGVDKLPVEKKDVRVLTPEQVDTLIEVAEQVSPAIHLFCALCAHAGLRKREAVFARWDWVDFGGRFLTIKGDEEGRFVTKSKRYRTVPISEKLLPILERYYDESNEFVIQTDRESEGKWRYRYEPKKAFTSAVKAADVGWCTAHTLRHTFASQRVQAGVSLFKVSQWLGHSNPNTTTLLYSHLRPYDPEIDSIA